MINALMTFYMNRRRSTASIAGNSSNSNDETDGVLAEQDLDGRESHKKCHPILFSESIWNRSKS